MPVQKISVYREMMDEATFYESEHNAQYKLQIRKDQEQCKIETTIVQTNKADILIFFLKGSYSASL